MLDDLEASEGAMRRVWLRAWLGVIEVMRSDAIEGWVGWWR